MCVPLTLYTREAQNEFLSAKFRYSGKIHFVSARCCIQNLGLTDSFTGYFGNTRYSFKIATEIIFVVIAGLFYLPSVKILYIKTYSKNHSLKITTEIKLPKKPWLFAKIHLPNVKYRNLKTWVIFPASTNFLRHDTLFDRRTPFLNPETSYYVLLFDRVTRPFIKGRCSKRGDICTVSYWTMAAEFQNFRGFEVFGDPSVCKCFKILSTWLDDTQDTSPMCVMYLINQNDLKLF